jgi:hypothetical protein
MLVLAGPGGVQRTPPSVSTFLAVLDQGKTWLGAHPKVIALFCRLTDSHSPDRVARQVNSLQNPSLQVKVVRVFNTQPDWG